MMLLRLSGAILVAASVTLAGFMKADKLHKHEDICRAVNDLLMKCTYLIRFRSLSVYELSAELKDCSFAETLKFISSLPSEHTPGADFSTLWTSALSAQLDIQPEELELMLRLGTQLGSSDTEGQLRMLEGLTEDASQLLIRRKEEFQLHGRLWRNVGTLAGLMTFVLII